MKQINIEPKLEAFLRKEKVLTKFKKNYTNTGTSTPLVEIGMCFNFKLSPEGRIFWWNLHTKYLKQMKLC